MPFSIDFTTLLFVAAAFLTLIPVNVSALTDEELVNIPLCLSSYYLSLFDYANATLFTYAQNSAFLTQDTFLSSNSYCSVPFGSTVDYAGRNSMLFSHFRFGLMGSDKLALCEFRRAVCYFNFNTGILPFRKSVAKTVLISSIATHIANVPRIVTYSTNSISPIAATSTNIYSPMATMTPFVPTVVTSPPSVVHVDLELQPTFFDRAFQTNPTMNSFYMEFALSAFGTCADANGNAKMYLRSATPNVVNRWYNGNGFRSAKVIQLTGALPSIPSAWKDSLLTPYIPIVVCTRIAAAQYGGTSNYGQWFSIPQFTGVPFHSIIATTDGGAIWNNSYLPTIANPSVNKWEIFVTEAQQALDALKAQYPKIYTAAYLSVPRADVPNPYFPMFNQIVSIRINKATIDNSPWVYFAFDPTLDVCSVYLTANFSRNDVISFNSTHYVITTTLRVGVGGMPMNVGGANVSLCGSAATTGSLWVPVTTETIYVSRCPYGRAYPSIQSSSADSEGCYSCAAQSGDWALCGGHGTCGRGPAGFAEVARAECTCTSSYWDQAKKCGARTGNKTKTLIDTRSRTKSLSHTKSKTRPPTTTHLITKTATITVSTTLTLTPNALLTCFFDSTYTPKMQSVAVSATPVKVSSATDGEIFFAKYFFPANVLITDPQPYINNVVLPAGLMALMALLVFGINTSQHAELPMDEDDVSFVEEVITPVPRSHRRQLRIVDDDSELEQKPFEVQVDLGTLPTVAPVQPSGESSKRRMSVRG